MIGISRVRDKSPAPWPANSAKLSGGLGHPSISAWADGLGSGLNPQRYFSAFRKIIPLFSNAHQSAGRSSSPPCPASPNPGLPAQKSPCPRQILISPLVPDSMMSFPQPGKTLWKTDLSDRVRAFIRVTRWVCRLPFISSHRRNWWQWPLNIPESPGNHHQQHPQTGYGQVVVRSLSGIQG
jgi:hypothetical protein